MADPYQNSSQRICSPLMAQAGLCAQTPVLGGGPVFIAPESPTAKNIQVIPYSPKEILEQISKAKEREDAIARAVADSEARLNPGLLTRAEAEIRSVAGAAGEFFAKLGTNFTSGAQKASEAALAAAESGGGATGTVGAGLTTGIKNAVSGLTGGVVGGSVVGAVALAAGAGLLLYAFVRGR